MAREAVASCSLTSELPLVTLLLLLILMLLLILILVLPTLLLHILLLILAYDSSCTPFGNDAFNTAQCLTVPE